ncbi:MAG: bacterial type secretion system domain protein [Micavibrio sp.]|nr:bacterial type secretion system domain protein [Micavibrio sp.]
MSPIILIVMLCIIAIFGGGTLFILNKAQQKKSRDRSLSVIRGHMKVEGKKSEKDLQDKRRAEIARKLQEEGKEGKAKKEGGLKDRIIQAGLETSIKRFWLYSFGSGVLSLLLMLMLGKGLLVTFLVTFVGFIGLPRYVLRWKIKRRQKKFLEDFADALEAMVRLLKAGMPVGEAIAMASREFEGPIGEEMSRIYDAQKIGVSLAEATLEAARRMPLTEMQMFATGISIQAQTGSSLSEVLTNLARVIRARYRLKRKVQALSSEAKASAMIIGSLPFLIGSGLYFINGQYMSVLFNTPNGQAWLIGSAVWMTLGCLIMKAMINFKI